MAELMSIPEAAKELGLDPSRVRALVASGGLAGLKLGHRWVVDSAAVAQRRRDRRPPGRPFEPHNAWALIFLASELPVPWLDASSRWRLAQALALQGLSGLRPRLGRRAVPRPFSVHAGELSYLLEDSALVRSGISAAGHHRIELVSASEADAYLRAHDLKQVQREHALQPADRSSRNVMLRVVPDEAWHLRDEEGVAPLAAVALDLADDPDPRAARIGARVLRQLDQKVRGRRAKAAIRVSAGAQG